MDDITLSPTPKPVRDEWQFVEVWIDPMQSPPYLLMLMGDRMGTCAPLENYRYAIQALKSSLIRSGKSSSISASVISEAKYSSTS